MSLKTWKEEFYPIPADSVEPGDEIAHSLRKWEGLRRENLDKHGVKKEKGILLRDEQNEELWIDFSTCSLCYQYFRPVTRCKACPLARHRAVNGHPVPCDIPAPHETVAPYIFFASSGDPLPMIHSLESIRDQA